MLQSAWRLIDSRAAPPRRPQAGFFFLVLVSAWCWLPELPPHAPSAAAAIQWAQRSEGSHNGVEALGTTFREMRVLLHNSNFLYLMSGFSIAMGAGAAARRPTPQTPALLAPPHHKTARLISSTRKCASPAVHSLGSADGGVAARDALRLHERVRWPLRRVPPRHRGRCSIRAFLRHGDYQRVRPQSEMRGLGRRSLTSNDFPLNLCPMVSVLNHLSVRRYVVLQKGNLALFTVAVATLYINNRPDNRTGVIASWAFLGLALEPLMPLTLEHAAEMTYPQSADSSTALLLVRMQPQLRRLTSVTISGRLVVLAVLMIA